MTIKTIAKSEMLKKTTCDLANAPSFIERQFPVAKVSMESFKERSSKQSQTLTGLGKWWGRKPLVLVRATVLGLLMPASDDPVKDRNIFLKLMTMDEAGLWRRKSKSISQKRLLEELSLLPASVQRKFLDYGKPDGPPCLRRLSGEERDELQRLVFGRMDYVEKLTFCCRPEQIEGPDQKTWEEINEHLGTKASSLREVVDQLGRWRFGECPRVGDAFCGAGSIPFEAARLGCDSYGSDLSPVASLLTWAAFNIVGGGDELLEKIEEAQQEVFAAVDKQMTEWGIEHNEHGWRADAYLYCVEVKDPESKWSVPLLPSRIVSLKYNSVATLVPNDHSKRYEIEIHSGVSDEEMAEASSNGTISDNRVTPPGDQPTTPIDVLRRNLRMWENDDIVPRPDDVFQERLYCVRWILPDLEDALCLEQVPNHPYGTQFENTWKANSKTIIDGLLPLIAEEQRAYVSRIRTIEWREAAASILSAKQGLQRLCSDDDNSERLAEVRELGRARGLLPVTVEEMVEISKNLSTRVFRAPTHGDLKRELTVVGLLKSRFKEWQSKGFIPSRRVEPGDETARLQREKGWTYWHHLFTPRQLLLCGSLVEKIWSLECDPGVRVACLVSFSRCADYNSRLSRWHPRTIGDKSEQVFSNQALNTLWNYAVRGTMAISPAFILNLAVEELAGDFEVVPLDARNVTRVNDIWITDPPYADAINYHELGEFFLAWYDKHISKLFPESYTDSKRALAVRGNDEGFRKSMVECYRRLADHMPPNGMQVVMFTHQDAGVWADLTMILWAAGLRVTSAWCIATETDSALKKGNYVQGTVLLICRRRTEAESVFLDEVNQKVETEVRRQLDNMLACDDSSDPNFADADYQLAAYAAALRVLTERPIEDINPEREMLRDRSQEGIGPVETLIRNAVKIACDHLVPTGIEREMWKTLSSMERFYLKGLEVETHGEHRSGVYQELARGFGASDYTDLLESCRANETRLKTAAELGRRLLSGEGFASSLVRHALFAVHQAGRSEQAADGLNWLKTELLDYWGSREKIIHVLDFFGSLGRVTDMGHWQKDSESARLLAGAVRNDHV